MDFLFYTRLHLLLLVLHLFADFTLQGLLGNLKQQQWWMEACRKPLWGSQEAQFKKYRKDYTCGLFCHALYWSIVTFAPLIVLSQSPWFINVSVSVNLFVHYWIDDQKCNRYRFTLWQDQLLHLAQISLTMIAFAVFN